MNERIKDLENKTDRQEQYSRLNCILLIHGIAENNPTGLDVMTRQAKKQELS